MTEREAAAWTARLARIWGARREPFDPWQSEDRGLSFTAIVAEEIWLMAYIEPEKGFFSLEAVSECLALDCKDGQISAVHTLPADETQYASSEALHHFAAQWIEFFRRGCWLSGCPIEASAHERAEWIQGFTREEVESWNLKF